MSALASDIPVKPNNAAIIDIMKNIKAHLNIMTPSKNPCDFSIVQLNC
jgi:hypothetical protein